jgi:hypothetical protein
MKKNLVLITGSFLIILSACKKDTSTLNSSAIDNAAASKGGGGSSSPSILQWQKTYGSSLNELGYAITACNDSSGYVFTGSALGNGGDISGYHGGTGADAWVIKINSAGTIIWQKCFGGTKGDYADDIIATADGGYVFVGNTQSNDGDVVGYHGNSGWDVWIVKLDASGNLLWEKTLGGSADDEINISTNSIVQTVDGGFVVAAFSNSNDGDVLGSNHGGNDAWIIKLNSNGDIIWQKTYGGTLNETANSIVRTTDGNYMVSATASSTNGDLSGQINHGGNDCWLFKINDNGDFLWQKTYGGSQNEGAADVRSTSDGGYVFSSVTTSNDGDISGNHGYADTWVVKIDLNGNIKWQKCFGGNDMDNAVIRDIDTLGKILLVGYTFSKNGDISGLKGSEDFWTLQLDANGNKLSSNVLGGRSDDEGADAVTTPDGMYMAVGRTSNNDGDVTFNHGLEDAWLIKFKF